MLGGTLILHSQSGSQQIQRFFHSRDPQDRKEETLLSFLPAAGQLTRSAHHQANLSLAELRSLLSKESRSIVENKNGFSSLSSEGSVEEMFSECIEAIKNYDAKKLESVLLHSSTRLTQPVLLENLVVPLVYSRH